MSIVKTVVKKTTVKRTHEVRLNDANIRELLALMGIVVPADACTIQVDVPGGGDWSNTELDIDKDSPVIVRWTETLTEEN